MATQVELSQNEIQKLCRNYLHQNVNNDDNKHFEVIHYELKPASSNVAGFLGCHQLLTIEVRFKDNTNFTQTQQLSFFTKSPPLELASRMAYLEEFGVFKKEVHVYRQLLPQIMSIFPNVAPKCYFADERLLVFENLAEQHYRMAAGRDGLLNYEHLHCALKTLAAMHAGSIVYEVHCGSRKLSDIHPDTVQENSYPAGASDTHMRKQNVANCSKVLVEFIKTMPKYEAKFDFISRQLSKHLFRIFELVKPSVKHQNVFNHGDLWANNIMFQYGKFGETPIQSRFVDFQLGRYASPLLDLMTLLTIPTSSGFRARYLEELLNDYYRFITEFLKREQLKIENYLSREQFEEGVKEYRIAGLIESCLFTHLTALPSESTEQLTSSADGFTDFFDRKRVEICMKAFTTDQLYRERLTDMLEDFVDRFVLE